MDLKRREECVTQQECENRLVQIRRINAAIFSLMGIFVVLLVFALKSNADLANDIRTLETQIETYQATSTIKDENVMEKLEEIKSTLEKQQAAQEIMLERVIKLAAEHNENSK